MVSLYIRLGVLPNVKLEENLQCLLVKSCQSEDGEATQFSLHDVDQQHHNVLESKMKYVSILKVHATFLC